MPSPLFYDFRRTLLSKGVLISILVIVLLSVAVLPSIKSSTAPYVPVPNSSSAIFLYNETGTYHVTAVSYNRFGDPLSGSVLTLTLSNGTVRSYLTNSSGVASAAIPTGEVTQNCIIGFQEAGASYQNFQGSCSMSPPGRPVLYFGSPIGGVVDSANSSRIDAIAVYLGPHGGAPVGYKFLVNYTVSSAGGVFPGPVNITYSEVGTMSSVKQVFSLPQFPPDTNGVNLALAYPNGTVAVSQWFPPQSLEVVRPTVRPADIFGSFISAVMTLIVPLVAIIVAYGSYGKDRTTGVLESVLSRPVSRLGLATSRYVSIVLALAAALVGTMAAMQVISQVYLGSMLGIDFAAYTVAALLVEAVAFVGLVLFFSHLTRSEGGLLAMGIITWVVLVFFWDVLVLIVAGQLGLSTGSSDFLGFVLGLDFADPARFFVLAMTYLTGTVPVSIGLGGFTVNPGQYGITPVTLVADAALWVLAPLAAFVVLAVKRD